MKHIQHSTFNAKRPSRPRGQRGHVFVEQWALKVEWWMFLLFLLSLPTSHGFGQSDTKSLPKLLPPYGQMPPTFWEQHGHAIIAGGIGLVLIAGLAVWWGWRPKPPVVVPPEVVAREALAKLARRPEDGKVLSEVSQALRRYVGAALELPASEFTTAEFCGELERSGKIGAALTETIRDFLGKCDQRKFSPADAATSMNAASRALELLALVATVKKQSEAGPVKK